MIVKLVRSPEEREAFEKVFNAYVEEALARAQALREERGKGYNTTVSIVDYFPHGEQDLTYELFKKLVRTESVIAAEKEGLEIDGSVEDSILDAINYSAFLYAYYKMRKEGFN